MKMVPFYPGADKVLPNAPSPKLSPEFMLMKSHLWFQLGFWF